MENQIKDLLIIASTVSEYPLTKKSKNQ